MKRTKFVSFSTGLLLAFIGIGGVVCGLLLMIQPDGELIKLSPDLIEDSPFETYFFPGLALFTINGVASLIGAFLAFKVHRLAGVLTMGLGIAMVIWIIAEIYWVSEYSFLQPTMLGVGVVEFILGFLLLGKKKNSLLH